ncbi:MAG: Hsp20/alpha crystallin family protein [bacterium]
MAILRWDPLKDMSLVQDRLNQFFKEALYSVPALGEEKGGAYIPPVDILETGSEVILLAELPGVSREDIDIQIEGDILILRGERRSEKGTDQENYYRMECSYGVFHRAFTLPQSIRKNEIQARFEQGVLEIRLPKEGHKKKVHVKVE